MQQLDCQRMAFSNKETIFFIIVNKLTVHWQLDNICKNLLGANYQYSSNFLGTLYNVNPSLCA